MFKLIMTGNLQLTIEDAMISFMKEVIFRYDM
jgi:hypothetical protein